jgi:two-component system, cell cycle sensor histidine kinase and response regulator CckA
MHTETHQTDTARPLTITDSRRPVILLVDDDAGVRRALTRTLERIGCTVLGAENGLDALGYALWPGQRIDLVITDMLMPVLGGGEFVEQLREAQPDIPVLYVSGYPRAPEEFGADRNTQFLLKPFELSQLTATIRGLLQQVSIAA